MEPQQEYQTVPLNQLRISPLNPRRHLNRDRLTELTDNVRTQGVLVPLLVRPSGADSSFDILVGGRRFRAAEAAGLTEVPVRIRALSDEEALEIALTESVQGEPLEPLDEAEGYRWLTRHGYKPGQIAQRIGKSESYVWQRLKLLKLEAAAKQALEENTITAGHAILLARLKPEDQKKALKACRTEPATMHGRPEADVLSVRELNDWINDEVKLDLKDTATIDEFPELREIAAAETPLELTYDWAEKKGGPLGRDGRQGNPARSGEEGRRRDSGAGEEDEGGMKADMNKALIVVREEYAEVTRELERLALQRLVLVRAIQALEVVSNDPKTNFSLYWTEQEALIRARRRHARNTLEGGNARDAGTD